MLRNAVAAAVVEVSTISHCGQPSAATACQHHKHERKELNRVKQKTEATTAMIFHRGARSERAAY